MPMTLSRSASRPLTSLMTLRGLSRTLPIVFFFAGPRALPAEPIEPAEEQLQAAFAAAHELRGEFRKRLHPQARQAAHVLVMSRSTSDGDLKKIPDFPFSFGLELAGTGVTDAGLKELAPLRNLTALYLHGTQITDVGLRELGNLSNLATLNLAGCRGVTDAGLAELVRVKRLASLDLSSCPKVTDNGLKSLALIDRLSRLALIG